MCSLALQAPKLGSASGTSSINDAPRAVGLAASDCLWSRSSHAKRGAEPGLIIPEPLLLVLTLASPWRVKDARKRPYGRDDRKETWSRADFASLHPGYKPAAHMRSPGERLACFTQAAS